MAALWGGNHCCSHFADEEMEALQVGGPERRRLEQEFKFHSVWLMVWMARPRGLQVEKQGRGCTEYLGRHGRIRHVTWQAFCKSVHVSTHWVWIFCVCMIICVLVCFSVVSGVSVASLWACGSVPRGVSVSSSLCISSSGTGRVTLVTSLLSYSLRSGGGSLPRGSWWRRLSACRPQVVELVKVSIQSSRGPESPWGHLGKVSELHLGSFIFEGTVCWINERNADFLEGS